MAQNFKVYSREVKKYKKDFFNRDEDYLVKKYFERKKTLVLGCGAGRTLIPLYKRGFDVTGIDAVREMVAAAKKKVGNGRDRSLRIKIYKMDAANLNFPSNSFDNVFFPAQGLGSTQDIFTVISEAHSVLKPQGTFIFSLHNRFHLKALPRFFAGSHANYYGILTYRCTPLDWWRLKKYFQYVKVVPQTNILVNWEEATWKEKIYKLLPFFDAHLYFVCKKKL